MEYRNTAGARRAALLAGDYLAEFAERSGAERWIARIPKLDAAELPVRESAYTAREH